jgi:hypothetical protein
MKWTRRISVDFIDYGIALLVILATVGAFR